MSTKTTPSKTGFRLLCTHCGADIGRAGTESDPLGISLGKFEMTTHECVRCHELTLIRDCDGYVITNRVIA